MGISSKKTTNKPIYNTQIEGAGNTLTSAYNQVAPKIQQVTDSVTGLLPGMIDQFKAGDAGVNAARDYNVDVLSGRYLEGNPYLEELLANSNNDVRNQSQAALGLKGLTGGSDYAGIIADRVGKNSLATRYQDYDSERARMATAAGQSPGIAAADLARIAPILGIAESAQDPLRAAVGYSSGLGGLLGQYQTVKQKGGWGQSLLGALSNVAASYAGGG